MSEAHSEPYGRIAFTRWSERTSRATGIRSILASESKTNCGVKAGSQNQTYNDACTRRPFDRQTTKQTAAAQPKRGAISSTADLAGKKVMTARSLRSDSFGDDGNACTISTIAGTDSIIIKDSGTMPLH